MSTFEAAYRATVYAPRSVDPTEATVLTPPVGAAHSDPFRVATIKGITGFQPYMDLPRGRRGRIDVLTRAADTGEVEVRLLDKRLAEDNLERWVTAFFPTLMRGCRLVIEESLNNGDTWRTYFTGRLRNPTLEGRLRYALVARDSSDELKALSFVGRPHASITYAHIAPLIPLGPRAPYGPVSAEPLTRGLITDRYASDDLAEVRVNINLSGEPAYKNAIIPGTWPGADPGRYTGPRPMLRVWMRRQSDGAVAEYRYASGRTLNSTPRQLERFFAWERPSTPGYVAPWANGTEVDLYIYADTEPTNARPLALNDVHLVTLMRNLVEGKFGRLNPDGSVARSWKAHDASFDALEADPSIGTFRGLITKSKETRQLLDEIAVLANVAWFFNEDDEVELVDMRPITTLAGVPTIGNADLDVQADSPKWVHDSGAAVTKITATYYQDAVEEELNEITRTNRIASGSIVLKVLDITDPDLHGEHSIDAYGFRFFESETARAKLIEDKLRLLAESIRVPFGSGPMFAEVSLRRTEHVTSLKPGSIRLVALDELPNPDGSVRGGARVMRAIEVTEQGKGIRVIFLDGGLDAVAGVPTIVGVARNAEDQKHVVDVNLTLNPAGDRVRVDFAPTAIGGSRPADTSSAWTFAGYATATGVFSIFRAPSRRTIHVRVRSEGTEGSVKLPSVWVNGSVDTLAYAAPSGAAVSGTTRSSTELSWMVNEVTRDDLRTEILVTLGTAPGSWSSDDVIQVLGPDTISRLIRGLDGPTVQHTLAVRHVDPHGGDTTVSSVTFTTTSTTPVSPRPAGIDLV